MLRNAFTLFRKFNNAPYAIIMWLAGFLLLVSCNTTKNLKEGQYLLRSNSVKIQETQDVRDKAVLSENLNSLIIQKPNSRILGLPVKLYLYNLRYRKYASNPDNYQLRSKTVEAPVVYDSSLTRKSRDAMRAYLFNSGFFYSRVDDTVHFSGDKARVTYNVQTGKYYLIAKNLLDVDDSLIKKLIQKDTNSSLLRSGTPFSMMLLEEERGRLTSLIRNQGYYLFSTENISFEIDTMEHQTRLRDSIPAFDPLQDSIKKAIVLNDTFLTVRTIIRQGQDPDAYSQYKIGRVRVYPDFLDRRDYRDSTLLEKESDGIQFRYHNYYLREDVMARNIFLNPGAFFSQDNYDQTITRLNDLGVFQYVRISVNVDTTAPEEKLLRVTVYMNPTPRYDFNTNFEVSSASTYSLGSAVSFGIRNRNFLKGANQLSVTASTGIELIYDANLGNQLTKRFFTRSRNLGISSSLNMPRFLVPFRIPKVRKGNLPRTIFSVGTTLLDRTDYFTLINSTASATYNWHQSKSKIWEFSPVFVNIFKLPYTSPGFQRRLDTNQFLANSYRETTIEGENLTFTYNNNEEKRGRNYSFVRLSVEEAGSLLQGITSLSGKIRDRITDRYSQYLRLDADARHFITFLKSTIGLRFAAGVGIPYGNSRALPYVKQYFAGGMYSIRGWRVRTLGPGSYYNPNDGLLSYQIDRTGDIRLEGNAEYRFDMFRLFAGAIKVGGATFADAGNIWLARADSSYPGGEFRLQKVPKDLAVSGGVGVRLNFGDFITLRIDGAIPLRKPYSTPEGGWTFGEMRFLNSDWRRNNFVWGVAIGYPF